ncbi:fumarylacetoacetate hydrolase family protein [Streptomyces longispororuber]|uniref:fumarylacetoacetate hydrolase family protein n=1 Tax=Streptomyces longispororuber TaxID=68230 RepID=UPI00210A515D|nr:fumarylacetoacetate hydrolase family protein [Streptomyces longispororuber]MCQ4210289.1 fumarylacetoacetate hydrolase family protein [Streptomyces longispororuber]
MRYTRVEADGRARWGRVTGDVVELLAASPLEGTPTVTGTTPLATARWLPPVVPPVFYAVGFNYPRHIAHANAATPDRPEVGYRANNALTGHRSPVVRPADVTGRFEAEPELVAVIGATLRHASYDQARAGIFGWTIGNDISARTWQHTDRTFWRAKNSDTFKPMGPWIETDVDALAQTTTLRVNGAVRAAFPTGDMVFDPYDYIVEMSRHLTLHPGDVLWMGAEATCRLEPGDTVDVEISGIGVLSNPVRLECPPERTRP